MGTQRKRNELPSLKHQSVTNWFNWPSRLSAVGPQVSQVVFDGGRRRAVSKSARAGYDASVAVCRQNTIDAFREVEDNLAALRVLEVEAQQQEKATSSSQESLHIFTKRYEEGIDSYLQVITAQTAALANERNDIEILRRRMDTSVFLIKAIIAGRTFQSVFGRWWNWSR